MGINIGNHVVVAANTFVNKNVPSNSIVAGNPAKIIGEVVIVGDQINFIYEK